MKKDSLNQRDIDIINLQKKFRTVVTSTKDMYADIQSCKENNNKSQAENKVLFQENQQLKIEIDSISKLAESFGSQLTDSEKEKDKLHEQIQHEQLLNLKKDEELKCKEDAFKKAEIMQKNHEVKKLQWCHIREDLC